MIRAALHLRANWQAFFDGLRFLRDQAQLILNVAIRDLTRRNTGHVLGGLWIILHPLTLTLVYIFIFGMVFRQRMGGTADLPLSYTVYILSGLIPWFSLLGVLNASCGSIVGNSNLVKQFVFPLEVLPVKDAATSLVVWVVGMAALFLYSALVEGRVHLTWMLLPVALAMQVVLMAGLAFLLSAMTVFLRDLRDIVQVFGTINIFLMPVVYLPSAVPEAFRPLIYANPFSYVIWVYRDILYFGRIEHPWAWAIFALEAVLVFSLGYRVFRKLKPLFGNVL